MISLEEISRAIHENRRQGLDVDCIRSARGISPQMLGLETSYMEASRLITLMGLPIIMDESVPENEIRVGNITIKGLK